MKNIYLLPTSKPTRLHFDSELFWSRDYQSSKGINSIVEGRNLYITSNEEIKVGEWVTNGLAIMKANLNGQPTMDDYHPWRKIILTTDQDLIKDGIQAIDEEFLEWFVNNSSFESVLVKQYHGINTSIAEVNAISGDGSLNWQGKSDLRDYEIIIPKKEPKFENSIQNTIDIIGIANSMFDKKEETLEDVFVKFMESNHIGGQITKGFVLGAMKFAINWQKEQDKNKFSEADIMKAVKFGELYRSEGSKSLFEKKGTTPTEALKKWLEQLKDKSC